MEVEGGWASARASAGLPLCSRTWARPAWAAALEGSAAMAAWNSCSASGIRPWARYRGRAGCTAWPARQGEAWPCGWRASGRAGRRPGGRRPRSRCGGCARAGSKSEAARWMLSLCAGGDVRAGADAGLQLCCFGVGGAELQGLVDLALGSGEVAAAKRATARL